jgi:kynureninase
MRRALDAIRAQGGTATPEGGWWKDADGHRLQYRFEPTPGAIRQNVTTQTISVKSTPAKGIATYAALNGCVVRVRSTEIFQRI